MKRKLVIGLIASMMVTGLLTGCGEGSTSHSTDKGRIESTKDSTLVKEDSKKEEALTEDLSEYSEIEWPDSTITSLIPKPISMVGKFTIKTDDAIWVNIANTSNNDYRDYIKKAQDMGYIEDYAELESMYKADNKNGYSIAIILNDDHVMSIIADETDTNTSAEE